MKDSSWLQYSFGPKASKVSGSRLLPESHFIYIHKYIYWISLSRECFSFTGRRRCTERKCNGCIIGKMLLSLALNLEFLLTSGIFLLPLGESGFVWVSCHLSTFILDAEEIIKSDWKIRPWNSWYRSVRPVYHLPSSKSWHLFDSSPLPASVKEKCWLLW